MCGIHSSLKMGVKKPQSLEQPGLMARVSYSSPSVNHVQFYSILVDEDDLEESFHVEQLDFSDDHKVESLEIAHACVTRRMANNFNFHHVKLE